MNLENIITLKCIQMIGRMSQMAKEDGFIVSMAPAESYLDPTISNFDFNLLHVYPEWEPIVPGFHYHGNTDFLRVVLAIFNDR